MTTALPVGRPVGRSGATARAEGPAAPGRQDGTRGSRGTAPAAHGAPAHPRAPTAPPPAIPAAVAEVLARVRSVPDAPLVLAVAGDGGTGKTAALAALRAAYRSAGTPVVTVRGSSPGPWAAAWPDPPAGTVLLVDDAHRLPRDLLDRVLDGFLDLVDRDEARVALTFRPWPRPPALAVLVRELELRSALLTLGPLDRAQVAERAAARLGRTPPPPLVDHVLRMTAGVPRLVDLLLTGTPTGAGPLAVSPRPTAPLPWDLLAQLDLDLGPAGSARRDVVLALALGAAPDTGTLAAVLDLPPEVVHDALGEARAAGLVRTDGTVVPVARQAVVGSAPVERARRVVRDSIAADLAGGASAQEVAGRVAAVRVRSPELAAVLRRAGADLRAKDPERAAELLAAAVAVGAPTDDDGGLLVERAESEALAGDVDGALRLAGRVLEAGDGASVVRAVGVATAALAHQGLLEQAAALHAWLAGREAEPVPLAPFAALACGTPEPWPDDADARAGDRAAPPTPRSEAERLLVAGLRASLQGDGSGCLPPLGRASALLRGTADPRPLPETPDGLAALAALSGGDPVHAQRVLQTAIAARTGGPLALPRHRLLLAWCAMLAGRFDDARAQMAQATRGARPLAARDELFRHALEIGIARRTHDPAALVRAWPPAREALLAHGVDLLMLLPLGEIAVAAARLDQTHHISASVDAAREMLARCGDPVLWGTPLHWSGVHAGIAAERPDALEPHAAALVRGARMSQHATGLAEAGKVWVQVLAGRVDAVAVERAARRLHAAGLGWDGSRLAAHAAARTTDQRATGHLLQVARDLQRSRTDADQPAATGAVVTVAGAATPPSPVREVQDEPAGAAVHLSERELEVAQLVLAGHTYREISERLYISTKTVEHHVARMRQRLGLESRAELLAHLRTRLGPRS